MISYRITKYDPKKRNSEGVYADSVEWISISDIGNPENHNLSFEEYYKTESCYVNAIKIILQEKKIASLKIDSLEIYNDKSDFDNYVGENELKGIDFNYTKDIEDLKNGLDLKTKYLDKTIRLILRELIWMKLITSEIEVKFGYDYYMYVKCDKLSDDLIKLIEETGIFVEPNIDQIDYEIIYENENIE